MAFERFMWLNSLSLTVIDDSPELSLLTNGSHAVGEISAIMAET